MVKDGVYGSAEKGYDVYINGKLLGWFRSKTEATSAYNSQKAAKGEEIKVADANKEQEKLAKEQEKLVKAQIEEVEEKKGDIVKKALILFIAAVLAFVINHYLLGWEPVSSFIISLLLFGTFIALNGRKVAITLLIIDIALLTMIETVPAWGRGAIGGIIITRMMLWPLAGLIIFGYRWYTAKERGFLPTLIMIIIIVIAAFYSFPYMNKLWSMQIIAHEEKYEAAYALAEKSTEEFIERTNESFSSIEKFGRALYCLTIKGDITCYNEIMHPPSPDKDIEGEEDITIKEYTKVEFVEAEGFPKEMQEAFQLPLPILLKAESPQKTIKIDLSCKFKSASKEYQGELRPKESYYIKEPKEIALSCVSLEDFDAGDYYVTFEANIDGIETESRLRRLFVGENISSNRKTELRRLHSLGEREPSKSADEFAAFSFGIGTPYTNPLLGSEDVQPIIGNIVNKAEGEITSIKRISVELPEDIRVDDLGCRDFVPYGYELVFENEERFRQIDLSNIEKDQAVPLLGCFLTIPEELSNTQVAKERSFKSIMEYSYKFEKRQSFEVMASPNITG